MLADAEIVVNKEGLIMRQKGSYTVEASLLMGILLSILVSVIYLGFWYHDRNFLQNAAYEAACTASLRADDESYQISGAARSLTEGRLLGTTGLSAECQTTEKEASVFYRGTFRIPGMMEAFFQENQLKMKESCEISTQRPSSRIQKVRQLAKIGHHIFERNRG